jgi:hypothetical protein
MWYQGGQYAKDKMRGFFALNYSQRHKNQTSGGFFVDSWFKEGYNFSRNNHRTIQIITILTPDGSFYEINAAKSDQQDIIAFCFSHLKNLIETKKTTLSDSPWCFQK